MKSHLVRVGLALVASLTCLPVWAQIGGGSLIGYVNDPSGAAETW